MKNTAMILGAFVLGAGIGAAAGLLLAPEAGSETRKKLADGAANFVNSLKDQLLKQLEALKNPVTREHANRQEEYDEMLGV